MTRQTDRWLATAKLTGAISLADLAIALADNHEWMLRSDLPALVADYSNARLLADPATLCAIATAAAGLADRGYVEGGLATPTALVVPPEQFEMLTDYARMMRNSGISREVFTCHEKAREWASEQAQLHAAQRAHRLLARMRKSR